MKKTIKKRLASIKELISKGRFDTLIILSEENRRYLSGYTGEDTQIDESAGALFINRNKLVLATDSRFEEQAKKEAPMFKTVCYKKGLAAEMPKILSSMKTKSLGYESWRMSVRQRRDIKRHLNKDRLKVRLLDSAKITDNLRVRKDRPEINRIKKSLAVAETAFKTILPDIRPGMTEKEAAWLLEQEMRMSGAEALSFPVITASGLNSALPHAIPGNRKIKKGEPLLFDWGAKVDGFCSDISRTIFVGKPTKRFKKVFTTVHDAQQMAMEAVKPGISSKKIDSIARDHIDKKGFKGLFGHGLGHGVGLAIHEPPGISPLRDVKLLPGMVFTVEPGIYIPGWGGVRLENMVAVTKDGVEILNKTGCTEFKID